MKIAYFGMPLGAWLLLKDGHELSPLVLSPVESPGRRRLSRWKPDLIDALELDNEALEQRVAASLAGADVLLSWFWTRRLPEAWLKACPLGAFGVHPSLLPRHRGPDPYFWTLELGDTRAGVSLHRLEAEYDTGAIIYQEDLAGFFGGGRAPYWNAWKLAKALDRPSLQLLRRAADELSRGICLPERAQDEAEATLAPRPTLAWLKCPWGAGVDAVLRRVRALAPEPGVPLVIHELAFDLLEAEPASAIPEALLPGEAYLPEQGDAASTDASFYYEEILRLKTDGSARAFDLAPRVRCSDGGVRLTRARLMSGEEVDGAQLGELLRAARGAV